MAFLSSLTNFAQKYLGNKQGGGSSWGPEKKQDNLFSVSRPQNIQTAGFQINSPVANMQGQALNKVSGPVYEIGRAHV